MMDRTCEHCKQEYGHDQDCPDAAWWETREYLEGDRKEGIVTISARVVADMFDGIYGEDR